MVPSSSLPTGSVLAQPGADVLSRLINLSGRQRMLSQRLTLFIVLAGQGQADAIQAGEEVLQQLATSQRRLVEGGDGFPGLFSEHLRLVFDGPTQARQRIQAFVGLAEQILRSLRQGVPLEPAVQAGLVETASSVLSLFNLVTQAFEQEAQRLARNQEQQRDQLGATVRTLAHEARQLLYDTRSASRASPSGNWQELAGRMEALTDEMDRLARAVTLLG